MPAIRSSRWKSFLRWIPALVLMGVIFFASSLTPGEIPQFKGTLDFIVKKGGHMTGYALLAAAYLYGLGRADRRAFIAAWVLAVLYGASDELHQTFTSGRFPSLIDVGFDALGALAGLGVVKWTRKTGFAGNRSFPSGEVRAGSTGGAEGKH